MSTPATGRSLASRYAPFLAIVAMLGLLMVLEPESEETTQVESSPGAAVGGGDIGGATSAGGPVGAVDTSGAPVASGGGSGGAPAGRGPAGAGGPAAAVGSNAAGQPVDALGRPLEGDKGKCAPGGQLQEIVSLYSPPCMPKLVGDNGGATSRGVTRDEILLVLIVPHYEPATQQALVAVGLAATDQQYQEAANVYAAFVNKRYELYGRKIRIVVDSYDCMGGDNACLRADAKALVAKHKPFLAFYTVQGTAPEAYMDELSRQEVVNVGVVSLMREWFVRHRPWAWTLHPDGTRQMDTLADYYCKKMWGKNATEAGDPAMRVRRRKLGIVTNESTGNADTAEYLRRQVSGGMCGTPSDGTQIYTLPADTDGANQQRPTMIARMKNDGITTFTGIPGIDVLGCAECDRQQFFPEILVSGGVGIDADVVGRLDASTTRGNRFGIGFYLYPEPLPDHEFRKVARDINPNYEPEYITEAVWDGLSMISTMLQLAGPRLTPSNLEQGAHTMPQIGGYTNANPWPGWKCCDPRRRKFWLGGNDNYAMVWDARELYWQDTAISRTDNQPGAWACVHDCRRFEAGTWPRGEPKQQ